MIGIQPNVFISKQQYFSEIKKLIQRIKSCNKMQGVDEILIPGERSFNGKQRRTAEGIEIDAKLIEKINSL